MTKTKSGRYFVSIQCEMAVDEPEPRTNAVGIDLGLNDFVTLSTGEKTPTPRYMRRAQRRLQMRQRRLSRTQKGSNNRDNARWRLARQHEHVANQLLSFVQALLRLWCKAFCTESE